MPVPVDDARGPPSLLAHCVYEGEHFIWRRFRLLLWNTKIMSQSELTEPSNLLSLHVYLQHRAQIAVTLLIHHDDGDVVAIATALLTRLQWARAA